jgi:hypothetical protein
MSMGNLGNFAGGVASGMQSQQRLMMQQQEMQQNKEFRERQMKMQEQDAAAREEERQRAAKMREESAALFKKYYGEQQEEIGSNLSEDGAGNMTRVPTMRVTNYQPGMDKDRDAQWYSDHLALSARYSRMTPEDMAKTASHIDTLKRQGVGELLDKVSSGDETAMAKLLKKVGRSPEGARLEFKPLDGVNRIVLADGTELDLKGYAAANATAQHYASMKDRESSAQTAALNAARTKNLGADADLKAATAADRRADLSLTGDKRNLLGAQAEERRAAAAAHRSTAARNNAAATATGDLKVIKEVREEIKSVVERDPTSADGKAPNKDHQSFLQGRATELRTQNPKMNAAQSVAAANKEWKKVATQADAWAQKVQAMKPAERKKKYGTADVAALRAAAIRKALGVGEDAPAADDETDPEGDF